MYIQSVIQSCVVTLKRNLSKKKRVKDIYYLIAFLSGNAISNMYGSLMASYKRKGQLMQVLTLQPCTTI